MNACLGPRFLCRRGMIVPGLQFVLICSALLRAPARVDLRTALKAHSPGAPVTVEAWVHARRVMTSSVAFLTLGDGEASHDLQVLLKRTHVDSPPALFKQSVRLAAPGARLAISGHMKMHERGWPILVCEDVTLLRCAPLPATVRLLLRAARANVPADEASAALLLSIRDTRPPTTDLWATVASRDPSISSSTRVQETQQPPLPDEGDDAAVDGIVSALLKAAPAGARAAAAGRRPPRPEAARERGVASLLSPEGRDAARAAIEAAGGAAGAAAALEFALANGVSDGADHRMMLVEGEVRGRRRLSDGFVTVDLYDAAVIATHPTDARGDDLPGDSETTTIRCVLHDSLGPATAHSALAGSGARLRVAGVYPPAGAADEADGSVLLASGVRLLRSSHELKAVRALLDGIADGVYASDEGVAALRVDGCAAIPSSILAEDAGVADAFRATLLSEGASERSWRASALHRALLAERAARLSNGLQQRDHQQEALQALEKLRARFPLTAHVLQPEEETPSPAFPRGKDVANHAATVTDEQGVQSEPKRRVRRRRPSGELSRGRDGSFWRSKKRPQLLLMAEIVADLIDTHPRWGTNPDTSAAVQSEPLQIIDIGGSKGYLAQHLAERFGALVNVSVVDIDAQRIAGGEARAQGRGALPNLHFLAGDASELSRRGVLNGVDLVLGLHACGGLSDLIIAHAVRHGAAFAVCTCCFLSNRRLEVPVPSGETLPRDTWLDVEAAGISSASELHEVLRAAEQQADPQTAELGAHSINALRAQTAQMHWATHNAGSLHVELRKFDSKFSARNFVIVGRPAWGNGATPT